MKLGGSPKIVVVGFMGAGKSAVARELARLLDDTVIDLDDAVTEREGRTPRALIDEEGEAHFREAEARALRAAFEPGSAARIIALGGGALSHAPTRELLARHNCFIIWLDAPFELCWGRIGGDDSRPFARDRAAAGKLYDERRKLYERADCRVEVGAGKDVETLAAEIEKIIRSRSERAEGWTRKDG